MAHLALQRYLKKEELREVVRLHSCDNSKELFKGFSDTPGVGLEEVRLVSLLWKRSHHPVPKLRPQNVLERPCVPPSTLKGPCSSA